MTRAATVTVRIADGRIVYLDGRACHAGELVTVPKRDAELLLEHGDATDPAGPPEGEEDS